MARVKVVGLKALATRLKNLPTVTKKIYNNQQKTFARGADVFLKTALPQVPVDTGMSIGTFRALARAVAAKTDNLSSDELIESLWLAKIKNPKHRGVPTFPDGARSYMANQTFLTGIKYGKKAYRLTFGTYKVAPRMVFTFQTVAWQLVENNGNAILTASKAAMLAYLKKKMVPNIRRNLINYLKGRTSGGQLFGVRDE